MLSVVHRAWPSATRSEGRLAVEVDAQIPLLPQLAAQLTETSRQVEQAVTDVCLSFQAMATRAQASVRQAEAVTGSDDGTNSDSLLETLASARTAFDVLLDRLSSASERARTGADRVHGLQELATRVEKGIAQVDSIAMSVKLLALNAKIEVARDGDRSAGFSVVATEMGRCADESSQIAEGIRTTAQELTTTLQGVASTLREEADRAAKAMETSRVEIESALRDVERAHESISARLTDARHSSQGLARDIGAAVMALQFQDRVSQRVGHVVDALMRMHDALAAAQPALASHQQARAEQRRDEITSEIRRTHTMAEERTVGQTAPSSVDASSPAASSGDVELF